MRVWAGALDHTLNESQHAAVRFALTAADVAIIHGPPGTGKTTTLVELIRQIVRRGERVLAVAPSNLAVDNLLERLLAAGAPAIRLGHPARVLPELRRHTLDELVENHPEVRLANKLAREAIALRSKAANIPAPSPPPARARPCARKRARCWPKLARSRTSSSSACWTPPRMVCATATGLDQQLLAGRQFDWCIMDEASQSTEPGPGFRCSLRTAWCWRATRSSCRQPSSRRMR
jgi:ATP-dependent RNA/DNA helicase IGHMBP2